MDVCQDISSQSHQVVQGQWLFLILASKQMSRTSSHLSKCLLLETLQGKSFLRLKRTKGIYISQDVLMWLFSATKMQKNWRKLHLVICSLK